jgi:hypothetical protein
MIHVRLGSGRQLAAAVLMAAAVAGCTSTSIAQTQPAVVRPASHRTTPPSSAASSMAGWQGTPGMPWKCVTGYIDFFGPNGVQVGSDNRGAVESAPFRTGSPPVADSRVPGAAYALTVANQATATAVITGFDVVFYNQAGAEIGQSTATLTSPGQIITPGQQWTWVESSDVSLGGQWTNDLPSGVTNAFPAAATCQVVYWNPS